MVRKVISLYTGAGGLDLGFEAAGFEVACAVEMDDEAVVTLRKNRDWPVIHRDIHEVPSCEILTEGHLEAGEADALIGGPPCQPFSKSGYWANGDTLRLDDPRAGTVAAYLRVLRDTLPKTFFLENVPGLAYRGKSEGIELIERTIEQINRERGVEYSLRYQQLNAAHYGVPQVRERVIVVGSRDGTIFDFPTPTHSEIDGARELLPVEPWMTTWDSIGDLEDDDNPELAVRGKWSDLLPSIPEGENYLWHTDRGGGESIFGWRRRYWSFLLKLSKQRPSWTIQAQPGPAVGPFHWKSRRLSARELCRLQTFPDDYQINGGITAVQRQLGNAVPAALAEVVARKMRHQLLGDEIDLAPTLIPDRREPVPAPEPMAPIHPDYHHLIGDHEAHPGTGMGYAAQERRTARQQTGTEGSASTRLPLSAAPRSS
ncbi:MAG: DNA cytosine methyltransferase [bacterium]|nr:DNA cytosine methyltransferase [bacterium]